MSHLHFQMGLGTNGSPFGAQPYGQGAAGPGQQLNSQQQLQNKAALANSLPPFPNELKGAAVTSAPNMVSPFFVNLHFLRAYERSIFSYLYIVQGISFSV